MESTRETSTKAQVIPFMGAGIVEAYLDQLDASDKTRETYRRALRSYEAYLEAESMSVYQASKAVVKAYRDHVAAGHKPATVNAYMTAVRGLYAHLEEIGMCPNVAANVKGMKTNSRTSKEALTRDQAKRLLGQAAGAQTEAELRDAAMLALMTRRGLRTVEVVRANVGDLRQYNGQAVLFVQGKGYADKQDFVILSEACLAPIHAYLARRGQASDDEPLFAAVGNRNGGGRMTTRSVSRIAKEAMRQAGIDSPHLTAHSLRHTAVTNALLGGASVQEVSAMARHASIETTMIYAHNLDRLSGSAERAADSYLGL